MLVPLVFTVTALIEPVKFSMSVFPHTGQTLGSNFSLRHIDRSRHRRSYSVTFFINVSRLECRTKNMWPLSHRYALTPPA